ncbi:MAG: hypothetical protein ABI914_05280 [Acidobacteriota bacterium]
MAIPLRLSKPSSRVGAPDYGLTPREAGFLRRLSPPWRIQRYLDSIEYDVEASGCRSPRRVLRERTVQCMDGALFAAAALRLQGEPPLLLDLEADADDDHVLALFRGPSGWGAIARSNYSGLRYREPVHATIRALALSYLEGYFNLRRQKTLRRHSGPVHLGRFDRLRWMTAEEDLWAIPEALVGVPHRVLFRPAVQRALAPVDSRTFLAGLVGRKEKASSRQKRSANLAALKKTRA